MAEREVATAVFGLERAALFPESLCLMVRVVMKLEVGETRRQRNAGRERASPPCTVGHEGRRDRSEDPRDPHGALPPVISWPRCPLKRGRW